MYLIAAITENNVIGSFPGYGVDWFNMNTHGCAVIMGRKTWDSLPVKPLPGRLNIVLSRTYHEKVDGELYWATSLAEAMALAEFCEKRPICIGGGEIFHLALLNRQVDGVILTRIHQKAPNAKRQDHLVLPNHMRKHWCSKTFRHEDISFHFEVYSVENWKGGWKP